MAKHPHDHRHDDDDDAPTRKGYEPPAITTRAEDVPADPVHTIADEQRERSAYYEAHLGEVTAGAVALDANGKHLDEDRRQTLLERRVVPGVGWDEPQSTKKK